MAATRVRFWGQVILAMTTLVLAALTATWPQWIELLLRVDPDAGSGGAEWAIVAALGFLSLTAAARAYASLRRREAPVGDR